MFAKKFGSKSLCEQRFSCSICFINGYKIWQYSDNTEGIYQHFTAVSKTDAYPKHLKVNVNDAFCGHFRNDYNIYWVDYNYSIKNILIDIENFLFTT